LYLYLRDDKRRCRHIFDRNSTTDKIKRQLPLRSGVIWCDLINKQEQSPACQTDRQTNAHVTRSLIAIGRISCIRWRGKLAVWLTNVLYRFAYSQEQICEMYQSLHDNQLQDQLSKFEDILVAVIKDVRKQQRENDRLERSYRR